MNKISRGLSRSLKGSKGTKYRIVLHVQEVNGLPDFASRAQVIWNRGQKIQQTDIVDIKNGKAVFNQSLGFVSTMYQSKSSMEPKQFTIRVKVYNDSYEGMLMLSLKQQVIDMSRYVSSDQQSEISLDIKFTHHDYLVKIAATISSELVRSGSDDLSSATTAVTESTDVFPASLPGAQNFYADAPVQEQEAISEENLVEQPAAPEDNASSKVSELIEGPAGLKNVISATSQTTTFQQKIEQLNLEETGRKIGKGVAELAFGERQPTTTEGMQATVTSEEVTKAAVEQHVQSLAIKPIVEPLLKGMMQPIEDTIHLNLEVSMWQAFVKVLFPWSACAKQN